MERRTVQLMLRVSLAASFLSAVADRFGAWGPPGAPGVAWGSWEAFVEYVAVLNSFAPASTMPVLAWGATVAEILLAAALILGWKLRYTALASGLLLTTFAFAMASALGFKAPLDYSVFSAAAGAFLLATVCAEGRPADQPLTHGGPQPTAPPVGTSLRGRRASRGST